MLDQRTSSTRRLRLIPALAVFAALALGAVACSDSDSARTSSSADCPARFGCATTAAEFQVINDTDVEISLEAGAIVNVKSSDRPSLNFSVPARSTSAKQAVILGDDGLQTERGYVRGRTEGEWTWTIRSGSSITEVKVQLALTDDSSIGERLFEAHSLIGQPIATWGSATDPVSLTSSTRLKSFTAIGSRMDYTETLPVSTWKFSAPAL